MLKKISILLIFSGIFINCNKTVKYPSWYMIPPQNDNISIYGTGEGFDVDDARRSALSNAASKLQVSVGSEFSSRADEDSLGYSASSSMKVSSSVAKISFNNYEVIKNEKLTNNNNVVLIKIDANKFIDGMKNEILTLEERIKTYLKTPVSTKFKRYVDLNKGMKDLDDIKAKIKLISLIQNANYEGNSALYELISKEYSISSDSLSFTVVSNDQTLQNVIEKIISKSNISLNGSNAIKISANTDVRYTEINGGRFAKAETKISVIDLSGKTITSKVINSNGSSVVSNDAARKSAMDSIEKEIKPSFLEYIS